MPRGEETFERVYETARALGEETRFRIYRHLSLAPHPVSVGDLASTFDLHPNAVRQHVARLEQAGLISSRTHREGGAGRPRRLYWSTPEPPEFGGLRRPVKAVVEMLDEAVEALPAERTDIVEFGRTWGRAWAQRRKRESSVPRSRRARVELLAGELTEWGWQPTTRVDDGEMRVETSACLFRGTPPGPNGRCCDLEEGLLRGLVEGLLEGRAGVVTLEGCRLRVDV